MRPVQPGEARMVHGELATYCDEVLLPRMRAVHPGAAITSEIIGEVAGLEPVPHNAAGATLLALTGTDVAGTLPFGTEAGILTELGLSAVVCGPSHIAQAHKPDKYVQIDCCGAACRCCRIWSGISSRAPAPLSEKAEQCFRRFRNGRRVPVRP